MYEVPTDVLSSVLVSEYDPRFDFFSNTTAVLVQNRRVVEQLPPACNLAACVGLSGTLTCIISALIASDPSALQQCLTSGLGEVIVFS